MRWIFISIWFPFAVNAAPVCHSKNSYYEITLPHHIDNWLATPLSGPAHPLLSSQDLNDLTDIEQEMTQLGFVSVFDSFKGKNQIDQTLLAIGPVPVPLLAVSKKSFDFQCIEKVIETYPGGADPRIGVCSSGRFTSPAFAPCGSSKYTEILKQSFELVTTCLKLDPHLLFSFWNEESNWIPTAYNSSSTAVGLSQVLDISFKDSIQNWKTANDYLAVNQTSMESSSPRCQRLFTKATQWMTQFRNFRSANRCERQGSVLNQYADSMLRNMFFSGLNTVSLRIYLWRLEAVKLQRIASLAATESDLQKILSVIYQDGGFGIVIAQKRIQLIVATFQKFSPGTLTFEHFKNTFLKPPADVLLGQNCWKMRGRPFRFQHKIAAKLVEHSNVSLKECGGAFSSSEVQEYAQAWNKCGRYYNMENYWQGY